MTDKDTFNIQPTQESYYRSKRSQVKRCYSSLAVSPRTVEWIVFLQLLASFSWYKMDALGRNTVEMVINNDRIAPKRAIFYNY